MSTSIKDTASATATATLLLKAASELERLRHIPAHQDGVPFPTACRKLLRSIPGNSKCVDCGSPNPDWASVSFGSLLCVCCSGRHRSYGVATSRVRSVSMDAWTHSQVLALLEGGNEQLQTFFGRHKMGNDTSTPELTDKRYHTKAARFYRTHLQKHTEAVGGSGMYQGREVSRKVSRRTTTSKNGAASSSSCCASPSTTSTNAACAAFSSCMTRRPSTGRRSSFGRRPSLIHRASSIVKMSCEEQLKATRVQ